MSCRKQTRGIDRLQGVAEGEKGCGMRKAIFAVGGALVFALGVGAGMFWSRNDTSDARTAEGVQSRPPEEWTMLNKKLPRGLAALTPEAVDANSVLLQEAFKQMTWVELTECDMALEMVKERLRHEMDPREGHICKILSLSADDLETYVRDRKPEWEFAKTELKKMREAGK